MPKEANPWSYTGRRPRLRRANRRRFGYIGYGQVQQCKPATSRVVPEEKGATKPMSSVDSDPCTPSAGASSAPCELSLDDLGRFENYVLLLVNTSIGRMLGSKVDAGDIVQEALLRAHQRFGQFKGSTEAELAGWLRQIVINVLSDHWRRYVEAESRQITRERSLDAILDQSSQALGNLLAASGTTPSQAAQRRDLGVVLADALAELSDEHRQVVILRSLRECSWDEVASQMRRSVGAARMLWIRALKDLRPRIEARL
jgi:RNA polymerase sigma-70 factor, ECF subfamily